jgi:hypothetical protein
MSAKILFVGCFMIADVGATTTFGVIVLLTTGVPVATLEELLKYPKQPEFKNRVAVKMVV